MLLCLLPWLTACAPRVIVQDREWVPCEHPVIDPRTHAGLARAVDQYIGAVNLCNALNGSTGGSGG